MRITGGKARGIRLTVPPGNRVRPAMDATREAVFSHLGPLTLDASVLDLFAGSGAYGLEALSRGAGSVDFVEKDSKARTSLQTNLDAVHKSLGTPVNARLHPADVFAWKSSPTGSYTLIFADPPYTLWGSKGQTILDLATPLLAPEPTARLILEAPGGWDCPPLPGNLRLVKRLGKGHHQPAAWVIAPAITIPSPDSPAQP